MSDTFPDSIAQTDWRRLLTPAERAAMLADIARVSLAAGAQLFPEQPWAAFGVSAGPDAGAKSPVEQLGLIEALLPALKRAFRQITLSPLTGTRAETRAVLPVHARHVTPAAWMAHARQGARQVEERQIALSYDIVENQGVKSFLEVLKRDCGAILQLAQSEEETDIAVRAAACAAHLCQMQREAWLEEVTARRGDWTRPPTARETLRPDYAHFARERARCRRQFRFDWNCPQLFLPPRDTWRLYETWCLLTVLETLRETGWQTAGSQDWFAVCEGRLRLTLAVGTPSRITLHSAQGRSLSLTYNQTFAEGRESLSHTMVPDITLSDGERQWIFDAKFKPYALPGEEGEDINQMHAYRDAIAGQAGRNVAAAWCLYAGLAGRTNRPHITYGRSPTETSVGALCLRPGEPKTVTELRGLLEHWLGAAKTAAPQSFPAA